MGITTKAKLRFSILMLMGAIAVAAAALAYVRYQRVPDVFELTSDGFGPVKLGMTRKECMAVLRKQRHALKNCTKTQFYAGHLDIHCSHAVPEGRVEFIQGWCGSHSSGVVFEYRGVDIFDTSATDLNRMFEENEPNVTPNVNCDFPGQGIATDNPTTDHDIYGTGKRSVFDCVAIATPEYWGPKPKDE